MSRYHRHLARTRAIQRERREQKNEPPCWCGEKHPYHSDDLDDRCGGTGELECRCGGDLCVCHNHGSLPCWGCPDCEDEMDEIWDDLDEDLYSYADPDGSPL